MTALSGFIIQRDEAVRAACAAKWELALDELNEHLWRASGLLQTLLQGQGVSYSIVRTDADFGTLVSLTHRGEQARRPANVTKWLTRLLVPALTAYAVLTLVMCYLGFSDSIERDAGGDVNLLAWAPATGIILSLNIAKAYIFARGGG